MSNGVDQQRYSAFVSYSHTDAGFARSLQRWLEGYRLPRSLRDCSPLLDSRTGRLRPVFRDADELTAAPDLSAVVREAMAASGRLIVVCTPHTPHSSWVGKEIALARVLLGDRAILTALFEGRPDTALHPALIGLGADGSRLSPLAADFRKAGDGRRLALLKLVAALAGVPLDALIRRDAQRRVRRLAASAAATGVITVIVAVSLR